MTTWTVRPLAATLIVLSSVMLSGPAAPPLVAQSRPPITLRITCWQQAEQYQRLVNEVLPKV